MMKRVLRIAVFLLVAMIVAAPFAEAYRGTYGTVYRYSSSGSRLITRYNGSGWTGNFYYKLPTQSGGSGGNNTGTPTQPATPTKPTEPTQPAPPAQPEQPAPAPGMGDTGGNTGVVASAEEMQMLAMVNAERAKAGVAPLEMDPALVRLARMKSQDMVDNHYFSHTSPTYGSPFTMLGNAGISYRTAGENIAKSRTVESAHTALMKSDGHRANILSSVYKRIGIGIVDTGSGKMITQLFVG